MSQSLAGKVAIVVGASEGVGRAYVLGLAAEGAQVAAIARRLEPQTDGGPCLQEVVAAAEASGRSITAIQADVRKPGAMEAAIAKVRQTFGRIDVAVYNAKASGNYNWREIPDGHWEDVLEMNVLATYRFMRSIAPIMIEQKSGSIILMTSRTGLPIPAEDPGHEDRLAYGVSKAALDRIGSYFSEELKPYNIAVNMLSPGMVAILAENKTPTPERFAPPLIYFAKQTAQTATGLWRNTTDYGVSWP